MGIYPIAILRGLTTAVASTALSVQAAIMTYQIQSATITVSLDNTALFSIWSILQA